MPALFAQYREAARGLFAAVFVGAVMSLDTLATHGLAQEAAPRGPLGESVRIVTPTSSVEVIERTAKVVEFKEWLTRVDGFDPKVIGVTALDKHVLRIQGIEQGVTTMIVTDKAGQTHTIEVFVTGDARLLQSVLNRAFPNSAIQATMLRGNAVLLRGWVTEAQQIASITELAKLYSPDVVNQIRVGGPQEVQLRVKIMEVSRSKLRTFGFNFVAASNSFALASTPGPITALTALTAPIGGPPTATISPGGLNPPSLSGAVTGQNFAFEGFLQALKEEGLLKIQAEPVLVTRSGEAARLDNGGEFPIPVPQSLGTVTIEWREFGVILEALPIVISPTRLRQQVSAEVSEKDVANGVTLAGTFVPGLTRRRVQSTVEMEFGQTLVLGGLVSTRINGITQKTPFLGELPLIGAAFSKKRFDHSEVELIVMITPEYVSPLQGDQLPPLGPGTTTTFPTDRELYCHGLLEVPRAGPECPDGACDPSFSVKVQTGTPWPGSSLHSDPRGTPLGAPTLSPNTVPPLPDSNLIAPPGSGPSNSIPPSPGADPGVSSRSTRNAKWPASSKPVGTSDVVSNPQGSGGTTQAGYQSSNTQSGNRVQPASGQKPAVSKPLPPTRF
ncbi:MAG: pilus assembly protein N-terminal domain-containing protein [Candidatus Saccharimonas sp.]|nr:pilus assembly protein N-terminal domain-containing protein [Planctomycetaceae bacterium]